MEEASILLRQLSERFPVPLTLPLPRHALLLHLLHRRHQLLPRRLTAYLQPLPRRLYRTPRSSPVSICTFVLVK